MRERVSVAKAHAQIAAHGYNKGLMKRFSEVGRDGGGSPAVKRRKQHRDYSYSKLISLLEDDSSLIAGLLTLESS